MTDRYTKTMLTIIAGTLVVLATKDVVRPLEAQGMNIQKVAICDYEHCAKLLPTGFLDASNVYGLSVIQRKADGQ